MALHDVKLADIQGLPDNGTPIRREALPFRPIQYLGNKLRALPEILEATDHLIGPHSHVIDLFTGTTVVAQGFAARGYRVTAADTQQYAVVFARALLGVDRQPGESCSVETLTQLGLMELNQEFGELWKPLIDREQDAVRKGDAVAVAALTTELPLVWRQKSHPLRQHFERDDHRSAFGEIPLITAVYAGFYFGVRQALILDQFRQNVELAFRAGRLRSWQYSAALTAIMSAASAAAHSAGKHFAQPLNAGSQRNERFLNARLLQDRSVDIEREFGAACNAIDARASAVDNGHVAWYGPAETLAAHGARADLFYLDPPYTAQQYSRFYHVLETICAYEYPQLFSDGELTTGLYPARRFKSAFSSKRKAPLAFKGIIEAACANGTALAISYSQSAAASRGNARMITLLELLDLCSAEFGATNVDWFQLSHRYRQFNSSAVSNVHRDDPEILITCKPR